MHRHIDLFFYLALFAVAAAPVSALQPRWTPPKPIRVEAVDSEHFNRDCINFKFIQSVRVRLRSGRLIALGGESLLPVEEVLSRFKTRDLRRLIESIPEERLEEWRIRGEQRSSKELADLNNWYRVFLDSSEAPEPFVEALLALDLIEDAHPNPLPKPTVDIPPDTPDFTERQGYLYDAPEGVNAPAAWEVEGGFGEGVKIIDIEGAWNFAHEDFKEPFYAVNNAGQFEDHGNAVIGILIGQHNGYGIDGICPEAEIGGHTVYAGDVQWPNVAQDMSEVVEALDPGDIFVIELHYTFGGYLSPMETWQENFDVIENATSNGIVCTQAAGNGSSDLDAQLYQGRFDPDNRHSGAIIVGAGNPPSGNYGPDRSRCGFSNYGRRVDLQGWGYEVTSAGYGGLFFPNNDRRQTYTATFSGTSSATPIVTGPVACIQGIYKNRTRGRLTLTGMQIRDLLVATGTAQNDQGNQGHIGPRPNLAEAIPRIPFLPCVLEGTVVAIADGSPIAGAVVATDYGFADTTDDEGHWRIDPALAGILFGLTASMPGYNDSILVDLQAEPEDTMDFDFALYSLSVAVSRESISAWVPSGRTRIETFTIANQGNGQLAWSAIKRLTGDANMPVGALRRSIAVQDAVEDLRVECGILANDLWVLAGNNDGEPMIYVLNREWELVNSFVQREPRNFGYKEIEYDGELLWSAGGTGPYFIYGYTLNGEFVREIADPFRPSNFIAFDPQTGWLYVAGTTTNIRIIDRDGNLMGGQLDRRGMRIYGLAWNGDDPDGYHLYILERPADANPRLVKMDEQTGDTLRVFEFNHPEALYSMQSADITDEYDINTRVLLTMQTLSNVQGSDRLEVYQLRARDEWMVLAPMEGVIGGESLQEILLTLDATELADTVYSGEIVISHNAGGDDIILSVELVVISIPPIEPLALIAPADNDTLTGLDGAGDSLRFEPVQFAWRGDPIPEEVDASYVVTIGSGDIEREMTVLDTAFTLLLDTLGLPLRYDQPVVWSVRLEMEFDTIPCERPFRLHLQPYNIVPDKSELPLTYALHPPYPNPFNSSVTFRYDLPTTAFVSLGLYDLTGRHLRDIYSGLGTAGQYLFTFAANEIPSGIYIVQMRAGGFRTAVKIEVLR